ncbi:unnamed protein product [Caenorhabditis bovis]|uniref:Neurotransmitter-gated ion-channel ligand-binding domain-containing protein n=1 Tax=Caenorhabditis bovis TaxID=2654633 RepID=A0A8S1EBM4_9PELO|nr:unnamed protein product [Caenorhabditis bovis]
MLNLLSLLIIVPAAIAKAQRTEPIQYELANDILSRYQKNLIPKIRKNQPINVTFSLQLYQIIQVNEPQQFLLLNSWVVEKWTDQMLGWNPEDFENETEILVRHDDIWLPDTTLYNSLEMDETATRKLMHVKLTSRGKHEGAIVELLYPTIYKISCQLNLRYFPFDMQKCRLTFGSWSHDNQLIDYYPLVDDSAIGLSNFLENDGWSVLITNVIRETKKYTCCPNNYTLLNYDLIIQRKPLYYVLNLIAPTAVITFISIVGFFTSSSVHDLRQEKITLGITTLLSMSIMIFKVSDKMPSTSTCVPLIGVFYTLMIAIISFGTLAASSVIFIQ